MCCMSPLAKTISMALRKRTAMGWTLRNALCFLVIPETIGCSGPGFWARRGTIDAVQFAPGAHLLAVGGRDAGTEQFDDHGDVKLYAASDGELQHQIELEHRVAGLTFDSRGIWLAVTTGVLRRETSYRDALEIFNVSDPRKPIRCFGLPDLPWIRGMAFSPDSRFLAVRGQENVTVWRTASWTPELTVHGKTRSVAFSPAGQLLAVAQWGSEVIEVWDLIEHRKITETPGTDPLLLDPSGRWWIFFDPGRRALVFYRIDERKEDFILTVPGSTCHALALSSNDRVAAIAEEGRGRKVRAWPRNRVVVWDLRTRGRLYDFGRQVPSAFSVGFLNEGKHLAVAASGAPVVFDLDSGKLLGKLSARPTALHVVVGGGKVATHSNESVVIWDVRGTSPKVVWQDRWRRLPWSPLE